MNELIPIVLTIALTAISFVIPKSPTRAFFNYLQRLDSESGKK